ncbi:LysR family transcriptional regulator [Salmonella enterica subsp. enterica serovar Enteritidis]|nr:LysR family transcriptional regulator [Salmonella enterica]EEL0121166.1 LysR family transcriptional regulator [Salmonella enterica]EGK7603902.1 LysR family transcriptional regulator [Salmonella enterica]EJH8302937.1 LysR family transcriptional regulator [Salmonella enterica]
MGSKGANKSFDYNLIKILDAVILSGNAAMAAKKLGITPAAVSLALKRLQSYYPEELFSRGKGGLIPTAKAVDIHQNFSQVMKLVDDTFLCNSKKDEAFQITLLGSDIFDRILINHFTVRNMSREHISELLFTAQGDLLISAEPLLESGIENQIIDSFKSFVCICSSKHMLSTLSQLSLHHFYSSRHALYQPGMGASVIYHDSELFKDELYYTGRRIVGYRSDSLNGLMSMIERTSLIALMPLKLALFYKNHRKYDIKFIQPPPELALKSVQVYASWNKNSRNISTINEMVSMLQTLSSFRR